MNKTLKNIMFYGFLIVVIVAFTFAIVEKAYGVDKVKTKEDKYFEDKGCILIKEKFKDKTTDSNIKVRVFEVNCNGRTWNVLVYKEKMK